MGLDFCCSLFVLVFLELANVDGHPVDSIRALCSFPLSFGAVLQASLGLGILDNVQLLRS